MIQERKIFDAFKMFEKSMKMQRKAKKKIKRKGDEPDGF